MDFARGKTVLITGATDGIGEATALGLARAGARVLLHGRNREKAHQVADRIAKQAGQQPAGILLADFSSLEEVRGLAEGLRSRYGDLRILINNAGIFSKERKLSMDGFELTFQINYLAPFLLTHLLLDLFQKNEPSRIINVTSTLHIGAELDFENLQGESSYSGWDAYATSKLALSMFTVELAARLKKTRVTVNHLHPGGVNTKLLRAGFGGGGISPEEGAQTSLYLAQASALEKVSGRYFARERQADPDPRVFDVELRRRLWLTTEELLARSAARPLRAGRG